MVCFLQEILWESAFLLPYYNKSFVESFVFHQKLTIFGIFPGGNSRGN